MLSKLLTQWWSGYHYCTASFNKAWTQVLRRLKYCSRCVKDSKWQKSLTRSQLEIRLNVFHRSTIPQKQLIIIIIIFDQNVYFLAYFRLSGSLVSYGGSFAICKTCFLCISTKYLKVLGTLLINTARWLCWGIYLCLLLYLLGFCSIDNSDHISVTYSVESKTHFTKLQFHDNNLHFLNL